MSAHPSDSVNLNSAAGVVLESAADGMAAVVIVITESGEAFAGLAAKSDADRSRIPEGVAVAAVRLALAAGHDA